MDINYHWYHRKLTFLSWALLPFSMLFRGIVALRRFLYKKGWLKSYSLPIPVIVVGNITVGGSGKTPTVVWLANLLKARGYSPGIISRGYKGSAKGKSIFVEPFSDCREVGDEAILLSRNANCPVVVNSDRVAAAKDLLSKKFCNVIISDDGLQHYRLARSLEIAVVDNARRFGNGLMLPAGPLREPVSRLKEVDFILSHPFSEEDEYGITYVAKHFRSIKNDKITVSLEYFANQKVHAVVAIGNPDRFFRKLKSLQIEVIEHVFPDHYQFTRSDIYFNDHLPVLMTEKDSVKCLAFAGDQHWYLPVELEVEQEVKEKILQRIGGLM